MNGKVNSNTSSGGSSRKAHRHRGLSSAGHLSHRECKEQQPQQRLYSEPHVPMSTVTSTRPSTSSKRQSQLHTKKAISRFRLTPDQLKQAMLGQDELVMKSLVNNNNIGEVSQPADVCKPAGVSIQPSSAAYNRVKVDSKPLRSFIGLPKEGFQIHRARGMIDLTSIQTGAECADFRSSVYSLLEELQRQSQDVQKPTGGHDRHGKSRQPLQPGPSTASSSSAVKAKTDHSATAASYEGVVLRSSRRSASRGATSGQRDTPPQTSDEISGLKHSPLATKHTGQDCYDKGLQKMTEDESDYANLWDSASGAGSPESSNRSSFDMNRQVMETILRTKGTVDHLSVDTTLKRQGMIAKGSTPTYSPSGKSDRSSESPGKHQFDRTKLESLKAKVDSLPLDLTDFEYFNDLKHSKSFLDISNISSILRSAAGGSQPSPSTPSGNEAFPKAMSASVDCKYTCHKQCEDLLSDTCTGPARSDTCADNSMPKSATTDTLLHCLDDADSGYSGTPPGGSAGFTLTKEEICSRIKLYNEKVGSNSKGAMTLPTDDSGVFQGCIQVYLNIDRPINMSLSSRPASVYDVSPESTTSPELELLPKNSVTTAHVNSEHTSTDTVAMVLKKFKITDNPRSFALFEQTIEEDKEVKLRKIGDQERPLLNFLRWNTECKEMKRFVLKENDSGEIMYEAFSIPELNNFLRMLDKEESLFLREIQHKYLVRRRQMQERMEQLAQQRKGHHRASKHFS